MDTLTRKADPGYFSALQIPLLNGRLFTEQDQLGRTRNVIISKKFAEQFFPERIPSVGTCRWLSLGTTVKSTRLSG